ncbi:hypothetical protein [Lactococcus garvieae]|uniref:hypothetical protein n=1 Tax=Lactococcus garvieae TaxID=1363 RepID=UPI0025512F04|nr:hypothetical protein [Lactococcus garvieae]
MVSRSSRRNKKGILRKLIGFLVGLIIVVALFVGGLVLLGRYAINNNTDNLLSKVIPYSESLTDASGNIAPASPEAIVSTLNQNASTIVSRSQGFIDSAQATTDGQTVKYTLSSSKMNGFLSHSILATNGDQIEKVADKVLESMKASGVNQPQLVVNLTDDQGKTIQTIDYK